ncbi:probable pathogenesis-related protein ARB_02861 [Cryptomeria japonica]|uniref:probable pathogenesis-related protein ARB_02861 n=1 Tax=Cryptomeria japonica TaxID=3369 RepID=UPI0027DA63AD|nr:probable pathogenesis-related protein ARB_02861 [Cryptomeria japonica]
MEKAFMEQQMMTLPPTVVITEIPSQVSTEVISTMTVITKIPPLVTTQVVTTASSTFPFVVIIEEGSASIAIAASTASLASAPLLPSGPLRQATAVAGGILCRAVGAAPAARPPPAARAPPPARSRPASVPPTTSRAAHVLPPPAPAPGRPEDQGLIFLSP